MPVTARLSKRFYDQFGDEIANDLVDWFNQVDATYRSDLHTMNELNFARFDAKVEQRFAEWEARLERRLGDLRAELIKWMFVFWAGTTFTVLGAVFAIVRL